MSYRSEYKQTVIELERRLLLFYQDNILKPSLQNNGIPIDLFQRKLNDDLENMIRFYVEKIYTLSLSRLSDTINKRRKIKKQNRRSFAAASIPFGKRLQIFTSLLDIENIKNITKNMVNQFWKTTGRLINRISSFISNPKTGLLEKKKEYDTVANIKGLANQLATGTLNKATVSKIKQLAEERIIGGSLGIEGVDDDTKLIFVTAMDDRVDCVYCKPLENRVFDADDPDLPDPPLHNFCRCELQPYVK